MKHITHSYLTAKERYQPDSWTVADKDPGQEVTEMNETQAPADIHKLL